ncbi:olfactory receptor 147-like [Nannospalax galili]|uniref:olfactory receptor 147-like n=1 Tax=Nannospalax galili TaxID=1026970 RepID=UPI0004ED206B|nr:olfactory receptor 147-like [Nannospalax galili]
MTDGNQSLVTEFILEGLTNRPELQILLFFLVLGIYVVTVVAKVALITLISLNSHLHIPMYYFLFNLSFLDICYSSVFTPKMLINFVVEKNTISYTGHLTQLYFFCFFIIAECYILTAMAYNCYVAICKPLIYNVILSPWICAMFVFGAYVMGCWASLAHTLCMARLTFCDGNIINHYLCDILPVLQLSCTSTYNNEVVVFVLAGLNIVVSTSTTFISYGFIISNVLCLSSTQGRAKAFNTCSSHIMTIMTVSLFFGAAAFMYMQLSDAESMDKGKVASVFSTNVGPVLNPLIYSLRNKDVKLALKKL